MIFRRSRSPVPCRSLTLMVWTILVTVMGTTGLVGAQGEMSDLHSFLEKNIGMSKGELGVIGKEVVVKKLAPEGTPYRLRINKELITPLAVILHKPELNPGLDRAQILTEYEMLRSQQIEAYCRPEKQEQFKKLLAEDIEGLADR